MQKTSIGWTEETWNPTTGCNKVSPGCKYCYAEAIAERFRGTPGFPNGFDFVIRRERFRQPLGWKKPAMIFVNSMSDLFHEKMPLDILEELFGVMEKCPQHIFQILTKRHKRLAELAPKLTWHPNIWMGVSIENQAYAFRSDYLRRVPASVRFISAEPLLGPLELDLTDIHWVIAGGESQPGCRPMDIEWARRIRDQCCASGVAFFLKQLGGHPDKRERLDQFPADLRIQEWPEVADQRQLVLL
jgi:protein gp37